MNTHTHTHTHTVHHRHLCSYNQYVFIFIGCCQFKEEVCSLQFTSVMEAMLLLKGIW